jgi:hypothetical protein
LQQGHTAAQTVFEIGNFSAHGRFGDGGNFGLASCGVRNFIDALDVDEGRVHVKRDEFEIGQTQRWRETLHGKARSKFGG